MEDWRANPEVKLLTDVAIPELLDEQLGKFTRESIRIQDTVPFGVTETVEALTNKQGRRVLGADLGGDKVSTRLFVVRDEALSVVENYSDEVQSNDGEGYLESLKRATAYAEAHDLPMGISWGGPMRGTKVVDTPKTPLFLNALKAEFGGDLANLSPKVKASFNDGRAGLLSAAAEAYKEFGAIDVLFIINGGGIGVALLTGGTMYATEAGHVEGIGELNTYGQTSACGLFGAQYTCVEQLGANKAGIEAQWQAATGTYSRAKDIEDRYKTGNKLAGELYVHSALVVAYVIAGTAHTFNIDLTSSTTAVVCHGGAFKFPNYGARIKQILSHANGEQTIQLLMTKDYTSNACLDGAAIAAITAA